MEDKPKDITELDFFTRQMMETNGFAFMWVYKPLCPDCGKARLAKLKKRDKVYACTNCNKKFEPEIYQSLLKANVEYTCPYCNNKGEHFTPWTRPKSKTSAVMLKFECSKCKKKLQVARMSKKKK